MSQQEAGAGAGIIVWPECGAGILQADEPALLTQAAALAHKAHIYLDMGLCVLTSQAPHLKDQAILIGPQGELIWSYDKARPVPGLDPLVPGDGKVPTVTTPYGRISNVNCFDGDFPYLSRQAGQAYADLMLIPSNDWRQIDPWHTQDITFRAIESSCSLVRQTSNGLAIAVDYEGRVLASSDYFSTGDQVMMASVPTQRTQTIYTLVGDLFAQLCIAGLLILMGFALVRSLPQAARDQDSSIRRYLSYPGAFPGSVNLQTTDAGETVQNRGGLASCIAPPKIFPSSASTSVERKGMSRLAQIRLAACQARNSACWTSGPYLRSCERPCVCCTCSA